MATFDSGRQRYSMNFYASHQRPLQRRSYTGRPSRPAEGQLRVDGVDKVDEATALAPAELLMGFRLIDPPPPGRCVWNCDLGYAGTTFIAFGGGRQIWFASVLRFCTIPARWNSSRAPERPRNRIRSKRWCVFRWANRISTLLRSSRDLASPC